MTIKRLGAPKRFIILGLLQKVFHFFSYLWYYRYTNIFIKGDNLCLTEIIQKTL